MLSIASRLMVRMGLALLVLSLLIRAAITSEASQVANTVTIVASVLAVGLGVVGGRVARRGEPAGDAAPPAVVVPEPDWVQPRRRRPRASTTDPGGGHHPDGPSDQHRSGRTDGAQSR